MLHGGDISLVIEGFGGEREDWLDLSTGINLISYHVDADLMHQDLQSLPSKEHLDACLAAARSAYNVPEGAAIAAGPGTQALIQWMPLLAQYSFTQSPSPVVSRKCLIVGPTYSEHANAFALHGFDIQEIPSLPQSGDFGAGDCIVIVNPNNPDGRIWEAEELIDLATQARAVGAFIVLDEAFADVADHLSLLPKMKNLPSDSPIVILRSFGKFFGLAGVRLGFAIGASPLIERLSTFLGPWTVSTPALKLGISALGDHAWACAMRSTLIKRSDLLDEICTKHGLELIGGSSLYRLFSSQHSLALHRHLAERRIWTRIFSYSDTYLRLGVPMTDDQLSRLEHALVEYEADVKC